MEGFGEACTSMYIKLNLCFYVVKFVMDVTYVVVLLLWFPLLFLSHGIAWIPEN